MLEGARCVASAHSPLRCTLISDVSPAVRRQVCKAVPWCVKCIKTSQYQTCMQFLDCRPQLVDTRMCDVAGAEA